MSPTSGKALVVDDEKAMRTVLRERLGRYGMEVQTAGDLTEAESLLSEFTPDVAICDVMLPDGNGIELLQLLRVQLPQLPVIMITAHGSIDLAVDAMKAGALDFLTKPLDHERLKEVVEAALSSSKRLGKELGANEVLPGIVGRSKAMEKVRNLVLEAAPTRAAVLISGESGTGKELVARAIHFSSTRADRAFIAVNAAAVPRDLMESEIFGHQKGAFTGAIDDRKGCFELADEGTLFLDEIGEMPVELQPKLLRVLEDGRVRRIGGSKELQFDVRTVSATNRHVQRAIEEKTLREDLFYRLSVFHIELPPLRDREGDVSVLAQHFVQRFNEEHGSEVTGFAPQAKAVLERYGWPGNVRELRNVVHRAVVLTGSGPIQASVFPAQLEAERGGKVDARDLDVAEKVEVEVGVSLAEAEKRLILKTLESVGNNKAEAARQLGLDVKTVRNKLKSYERAGDAG